MDSNTICGFPQFAKLDAFFSPVLLVEPGSACKALQLAGTMVFTHSVS